MFARFVWNLERLQEVSKMDAGPKALRGSLAQPQSPPAHETARGGGQGPADELGAVPEGEGVGGEQDTEGGPHTEPHQQPLCVQAADGKDVQHATIHNTPTGTPQTPKVHIFVMCEHGVNESDRRKAVVFKCCRHNVRPVTFFGGPIHVTSENKAVYEELFI